MAILLHEDLPWSMQKQAALFLSVLMQGLRKSCEGADGQRQYLSHVSASEVLGSQIERYSKAGPQQEKNEKEEESSRPVL